MMRSTICRVFDLDANWSLWFPPGEWLSRIVDTLIGLFSRLCDANSSLAVSNLPFAAFSFAS